jgi:hypothetical protein
MRDTQILFCFVQICSYFLRILSLLKLVWNTLHPPPGKILNFSWPLDGVQGPSDCGPRGQDPDPVATLHPRLHPHQHPARHLPPHSRGVSGLRSGQQMYIVLLFISSRRRGHLRCVNFVSIRHGPDILTIVCAPGHAGDWGGRQFYNGANAP